MAAVEPQQSGDGDWKSQLQLPAADLRYKTEVSMRTRGTESCGRLKLSPTVLLFLAITTRDLVA
jgi:hypothetical protein